VIGQVVAGSGAVRVIDVGFEPGMPGHEHFCS
jgi:hypothetical protein